MPFSPASTPPYTAARPLIRDCAISVPGNGCSLPKCICGITSGRNDASTNSLRMILKDKNAVIYGAGGSLGGAVARAFAAAGARVFLTGYRPSSLEKVTEDISRAGGKAEMAIVDGFDE